MKKLFPRLEGPKASLSFVFAVLKAGPHMCKHACFVVLSPVMVVTPEAAVW